MCSKLQINNLIIFIKIKNKTNFVIMVFLIIFEKNFYSRLYLTIKKISIKIYNNKQHINNFETIISQNIELFMKISKIKK